MKINFFSLEINQLLNCNKGFDNHMKDYSKITEYEYEKFYYNENNQLHKLIGPAIEWQGKNKSYCINNIFYMTFLKKSNKLYIRQEISELNSEYEIYIKQNIKDLIQEYNPEIKFLYLDKEKINQLPDFIKDFIIL